MLQKIEKKAKKARTKQKRSEKTRIKLQKSNQTMMRGQRLRNSNTAKNLKHWKLLQTEQITSDIAKKFLTKSRTPGQNSDLRRKSQSSHNVKDCERIQELRKYNYLQKKLIN